MYNVGTNTSVTVNGLPLDGRTLHVRLWSKIINTWDGHFADATFKARTGLRPQLTNPEAGATLTSSTVTFNWSQGEGVEKYFLEVGSVVGGTDLFSRNLEQNLSATVAGLPLSGSPVFARLWWRVNGKWDGNYVDTQFRGGSR